MVKEKTTQFREREERIALCFTEDEKDKVEAYANKQRLPASTLIRKIILDKAAEAEEESNGGEV